MKIDEAMDWLKFCAFSTCEDCKHEDMPIEWCDEKMREAVTAIEALSAEPTNCINCKHYTETEDADGIHGNCTHDTISRADAIEAVKETLSGNVYWDYVCDAVNALKALPSAEVMDRLYIKIYADDEPAVKAEKLCQICDETQNRELTKWLKEYFPSAEAVQGEWKVVEVKNGEYWNTCSLCQCTWANDEGMLDWNFCPNCGAKMKGGDIG